MNGLLAPILLALAAAGSSSAQPAAPEPIEVRVDAVYKAQLHTDGHGRYWYSVRDEQGQTLEMTPDAFARYAVRREAERDWFYKLLNITSPWGAAWVGLGLLGQVLFTGRMLVQWLVSEKQKRSIVPPVFWWMSLGGASMLLIYFIWRKDIVGVLGQSTGWFIYLRNLVLLYRHRP